MSNIEPYDPDVSTDCHTRVVSETKYPVGTQVNRVEVNDSEQPSVMFVVVHPSGDVYRSGEDIAPLLPAYLQQDAGFLVVSLKKHNELRVQKEVELLRCQSEAKTIMEVMKRRFDAGDAPEPTDFRLSCYLRKIQLTRMRELAAEVELVNTVIARACETFMLNITYWLGANIPLMLETLSDEREKGPPEITGVRVAVSDVPKSQDNERWRDEFLTGDCRFVFPQQWAMLTGSKEHLAEAHERAMGPVMFAKFKSQSSGVIHTPGAEGGIIQRP